MLHLWQTLSFALRDWPSTTFTKIFCLARCFPLPAFTSYRFMHPKTSSRLPTSMTSYLEFSCFIKAFLQGILALLHNWGAKNFDSSESLTLHRKKKKKKKKMIQIKGSDKKEAENISFLIKSRKENVMVWCNSMLVRIRYFWFLIHPKLRGDIIV